MDFDDGLVPESLPPPSCGAKLALGTAVLLECELEKGHEEQHLAVAWASVAGGEISPGVRLPSAEMLTKIRWQPAFDRDEPNYRSPILPREEG